MQMSAQKAMGIFVLYATLTGITFSAIFLMYTESSIASTFLVTSTGTRRKKI